MRSDAATLVEEMGEILSVVEGHDVERATLILTNPRRYVRVDTDVRTSRQSRDVSKSGARDRDSGVDRYLRLVEAMCASCWILLACLGDYTDGVCFGPRCSETCQCAFGEESSCEARYHR